MSTDLAQSRQLPDALSRAPASDPADMRGIFSGSAIDAGGVLSLLYTGFTDTARHPDATPEAIDLATSRDGRTFALHGRGGDREPARPDRARSPGDGEQTRIVYDRPIGRLWIDRSRSGIDDCTRAGAPILLPPGGKPSPRVLVDRDSVEVLSPRDRRRPRRSRPTSAAATASAFAECGARPARLARGVTGEIDLRKRFLTS